MARRKGSKDKKKRSIRQRLKNFPVAATLTGATIGLGAVGGAELMHRMEVSKTERQISTLRSRLGALTNKTGPRGVEYARKARELNNYLNSNTLKIRPRLIGGAGGAAIGALVGTTLFAPTFRKPKPGKETDEDRVEKKKQNRKNLASINQSSREVRGWINLGRRFS